MCETEPPGFSRGDGARPIRRALQKPVGVCTVLGKSFPFMEHGSFSSSKEYCPDFQAPGSRFLLRAFGMISGIFAYFEKIVGFA